MNFKNKTLFLIVSFLFSFVFLTGNVFAQNNTATTYSTDYAPTPETNLRVEVSPIFGSVVCFPVTVIVKTNIPANEVRIIYKSLVNRIDTYAMPTMIDQYTWKYEFNFSEWPDGPLNMQIESLFPNDSSYGYINSVPYSFTKNSAYCESIKADGTVTAPPSSTSIASTTIAPKTTKSVPTTTQTPTNQTAEPAFTNGIVTDPTNLVKDDVEKINLFSEDLQKAYKISRIENKEVQDQDSKVKRQVINFNGKASPNSIVYLYVFSDPIIISVQADANGDWEYTLDKPLERGKHEVYLVMQDETTKEIKRTEGSSFFITKAVAKSNFMDVTGDRSLTLEDPFVAIFRQYILYVGVAILFAIFVIISINLKKRRKVERLENGDE